MNPLWVTTSLVLVAACAAVAWTARRVAQETGQLTRQVHDLRRARAEVHSVAARLEPLDTSDAFDAEPSRPGSTATGHR